MKKLIPLIACLALASCKKTVDEDAVRLPPAGKTGIRFYHHMAGEKCFYQSSEWHMTSNVNGEVLVLRETDCAEKLKAVAEPIGASEAAP